MMPTESESLLEDFLSEIQSLEDFRSAYRQRYEFESLDRDDQDIRRLIEAMAFYAARSRGVAARAMRRHKLQALERLFPYLLTPMPAMALLHPTPVSMNAGWLQLPEGAEFVASETDSRGELLVSRVFSTCAPAQVLPLHIVRNSVSLQNKATHSTDPGQRERGWLLSMTISADPRAPSRFFTPEGQPPLESFTLHINPLGEALLPIRLFDALQNNLERMCLRVKAGGELRFAKDLGPELLTQREGGVGASWSNPLERIRRVVHFPLGELGFRVDVRGAPTQWETMELQLHLGEGWPTALSFHDESFVINPVVVHNVTRALAEVVEHDGTRSRWRISHVEPGTGWRVREVLGVYRADPELPGAREVVLPGVLAHGGYAVEVEGRSHERAAWLEVDSTPDGSGQAQSLQVEADWYDPGLQLPNPKIAKVLPEEQDSGVARWSLLAPLQVPRDSPVLGDDKRLEELLEMHARGAPNVKDLRALLKALGTDDSEAFRRLPSAIAEVELLTLPDALSPRGASSVFELSIAFVPPVLVPAMRLLLSLLPQLLAVWTGLPDVKLRATFRDQPEVPPLLGEWRE